MTDPMQRWRASGLRHTRPRQAVLTALLDLGGHHSADEVHLHLANTGVPLPRASVYNSLAALAEHGVVLRADVGPGAAVYEAARHWHHHFVCRRCGRIVDVPCLVGEKPCLSAGTEVGTVDEAQVILRGTCRACLNEVDRER